MKILAIDTSSANCSVAVAEAKENKVVIIEEQNNQNEKMHSEGLMPMVDSIFKKNDITISDCDLIACGIGPGSFTGIRIGIAACKGFVDSQNLSKTNRKVLACAVNSLESLAYNVINEGIIVSLIDCRNKNVYAGMTEHDGSNYKRIGDLLCDDIETVLLNIKEQIKNQKVNSITIVGNGSTIYKELIKKDFNDFNITFSEYNIQNASSIAKCAYNKYRNNEVGGQEILSPLYLRLSQAERQLRNKEGKR